MERPLSTDMSVWLSEYDYDLTPWQTQLVVRDMFGKGKTHRIYDRQVGATYAAEARMLYGIEHGESIVYLGDTQAVADNAMHRMHYKLCGHGANPGKFSARWTNGQKALWSNTTGGHIKFRSVKGDLRVLDMVDLVIIDAAGLSTLQLEALKLYADTGICKLVWLQGVDLNAHRMWL